MSEIDGIRCAVYRGGSSKGVMVRENDLPFACDVRSRILLRDEVMLADGRKFTVSIVDAGNLIGFCDARQLGLQGTEIPAEFDANKDLQAKIEERRCLGAELSGLANWHEAPKKSSGMPKKLRLRLSHGQRNAHWPDVSAIDAQILHGRGCHVYLRCCRRNGHPVGVMDSTVGVPRQNGETILEGGSFARTAHPIMEGFAFL